MSSERIQELIISLSKLPGIGPRQAGRLVYHLLDEKQEYKDMLVKNILALADVKRCSFCFQAFENRGNTLCSICIGNTRDKSTLMVVEKDMDYTTIDKAGIYNGLYFILGGVISPLRPNNQERTRMKELFGRVQNDTQIAEIILATSATPEGDHTARFIEKILEPLYGERKTLRLTRLGRGLSTGSELEYSDPETFKNAYVNRK